MDDTEKIKQIFAYNLKKYMKEAGINQKKISEIAGVSQQSVTYWTQAKLMPRMGAVQKLADYFGIMKSDLLEDKDMYPSNINNIEEAMITILSNPSVAFYGGYDLDKMTDEEKIEFANQIADSIKFFAKRYRK